MQCDVESIVAESEVRKILLRSAVDSSSRFEPWREGGLANGPGMLENPRKMVDSVEVQNLQVPPIRADRREGPKQHSDAL